MNIILGISGSIAAYKSPLLARELMRRGAAVRVVMTPAATQFIPALTLQNLTRYAVAVEMFDEAAQAGGSWHIHLARWCDTMLIAPCSANTLARLAHGFSDTALSAVATALSPKQPLVVAPAMDTEMWLHPTTERNCGILRADGVRIIPPEEGELASGFVGAGRLPETDVLVQAVFEALGKYVPKPEQTTKKPETSSSTPSPEQHFTTSQERFDYFAEKLEKDAAPSTFYDYAAEARFDAELELSKLKGEQPQGTASTSTTPFPLAGKRVLITAGPTYEKIDDVRFIGNYSSGKMGFALAAEAVRLGAASVELIAGPVSLPTPPGSQRSDVESAREMFDAVMERRANTDIIILAAAVADFMPFEKYDGKLKKENTGETMTLYLTKTPDILAAVGAVKSDRQIIVGFALEAADHLENARKKLTNKHADLIVLNALAPVPSNAQEAPAQTGFSGNDNTITLVEPAGEPRAFPPMSKVECARVILQRIRELLR
jgi:phosphopantothenoylcysteine decarboxylase / phosphopantothenate---cysteine ligase